MNTTATEYEAADRALTAVLTRVPPSGWSSPSPCAGWSAGDVVRHMIDTQRELLTGHGIDLGEAPDVDSDPASAWQEHAKRIADVLADDAVAATAYDGYYGPTTLGRTLEQFYIWDMLVHRWDVARAVGIDAAFSDAELDRIEQGADSFGNALYMEGVCTPGVEAPPDADRAVRLLARLGRAA
jgi:uncharacterized protein (TIGR03086 family)